MRILLRDDVGHLTTGMDDHLRAAGQPAARRRTLRVHAAKARAVVHDRWRVVSDWTNCSASFAKSSLHMMFGTSRVDCCGAAPV
jgi:hypothetical protein